MSDLYSILGVSPDASGSAIKAAYRDLAKQSHPDLHIGDDEAEDRTKEINQAYAVLSDPEKRAAYDDELALRAAKKRRLFFGNTSAVSAGLTAFAVTAAALAITVSVTSRHGSQPWLQSEPVSLASSSQPGDSFGETPESAAARYATAAAEASQAGGVQSGPARELANAAPEARETPQGSGATAQAPVRVASAAPALSGSPRDSAFRGAPGVAFPALPGMTPAPKAGSVSSSLLALATGMQTREAQPEQATLMLAPRPDSGAAAVVAGNKQATEVSDFGRRRGAGLDRSAPRRERTAVRKTNRKPSERASTLETGSFVPPLAQESEPAPWATARKTTALRSHSGDEPFGGLR